MRGYRLGWLTVSLAPMLSLSIATSARALPPGTYQQSCTQAVTYGSVLVAYCNDIAGVPQATALADFGACPGDIFNADGKLFCARGAEPPRGTYQASCDQIAIDGGDLRATCRAAAGYRAAARLRDFRQCKQPIDNVDGALVCRP